MKTPKFRVGQVLIYDRPGKQSLPAIVREVTEDEGEYFYRIDKKNCFHEPMLRALNNLEIGIPTAPVAEPTAPVQTVAEQREWEWGVTYSYLYFHPGDRRNLKKPLIFKTELEADDCIAGKMDCSPQMMREAEDIRKLKRTPAGTWMDSDTKGEA